MKKKLIIAAAVILVLAAGGYGAYRYAINYVFDNYILETALSSAIKEGAKSAEQDESVEKESHSGESKGVATPDVPEPVKKKPLSKTEIVRRIVKSQELTDQVAAMVPYEEKKKVINIVMSNFTADELTEIATNAGAGMSSEYKAQLMAEAQARLTTAQWNECMAIATKYIEAMRPYVE